MLLARDSIVGKFFEILCSPTHGHDEESRNGRDMKIDILDDYVWTSEWFRVSSGIYRSTGGYRNPPGLNGLTCALVEERGGGQEVGRAPQAQSKLGGGPAPLSFFFSSPSFPLLLGLGEVAGPPLPLSPSGNPSPTRIGGGVLLPIGVELLPRPPPGRPPLPLGSFIY